MLRNIIVYIFAIILSFTLVSCVEKGAPFVQLPDGKLQEVGKDSISQNESELSKEEIFKLFQMKKQDIITRLGKKFEETRTGVEGSYLGYRYEDLGITVVYAEDKLDFIICNEKVSIDGAHAGMNFAQIQEKLGNEPVEETFYETLENKAYEVNYTFGDIQVSFLSFEPDGRESQLTIYKKN